MATFTTIMTTKKPSRSDDVLDASQELEIYNEIRSKFDSLAPKRPTKPNRSDPDNSILLPVVDTHTPIPELLNLRSLQSQAIFAQVAEAEQNEFVETQYYRALSSIDKQHHTTGSGFIKVDWNQNGDGGSSYDFQVRHENEMINGGGKKVSKTNPARNDWIPKSGDFDFQV